MMSGRREASLEYLPRPALSRLCRFLPPRDKNSLRLAATKLANTIPGVTKHYESGLINFPVDGFEAAMRDVEAMQRKASAMPSSPPEYHLFVSLRHDDSYLGQVRFSKRLMKVSLGLNSRNAYELESSLRVITSLRESQANVTRLDLEIYQHGAKLPASEFQFPHLRSIELRGDFEDTCSEVTDLLSRFSDQLEHLSIDDESRALSFTEDNDTLPEDLTYLHIDIVTSANVALLESCADNLKAFSTSFLEAYPRMGLQFPMLRAVNAWSQGALHLLPENSPCQLECLMLLSTNEVDMETTRDLITSRQFPLLRYLCVDSDMGEPARLLLEKCCRTLTVLEIYSGDPKKRPDFKEAELVFPKLKDLTFVGEDTALLDILTFSFPALEVVRLVNTCDEMAESLPGHLQHVKNLSKVVVETTDSQVADLIRDNLSCEVEVHDNIVPSTILANMDADYLQSKYS